MTQFEKLDLLLHECGGTIQTFQVLNNGISKSVFYAYVKERGLEQAAHGVYVSPNTWTDAMYLLHLRCGQAVFSHETALFFHDLTDREPLKYTITVRTGYNPSRLQEDGFQVYTVKKDLIRNMSKKKSADAQILMRNYMMERFLERISLSEYKNQFILKGGMLVAAMVGLDARATMDLDATIKGTNVSVEDVEMIISQIISIPLDDGVSFRVKRISEIMEEADYPGVRVSMETKFDGVITPLKIDISTGDVITPREIKYKFNLMLEDRTIEVWAYNLETVLAEKLETVVSRNVTNTRMRDFYDIYILQKLYGEQLQKQVLWTALVATSKKRGTLDLIEAEDIREIFDEIESSPVMETLWKTYQKNYSYAADISWHAIVKSICALYGSILENMYDT